MWVYWQYEHRWVAPPSEGAILDDVIQLEALHPLLVSGTAQGAVNDSDITECLTGTHRIHLISIYEEGGINRYSHPIRCRNDPQLKRVQCDVAALKGKEEQEPDRQNAEQRKFHIHDEDSIASEWQQVNPLDNSGGISYLKSRMVNKQDSSLLSGMAREPHITEILPVSILRHAASHLPQSTVLLGFNNVKRNRRPTNAGQNRDCSTHGGGDESHPTLSLAHEGGVGIDELIVRQSGRRGGSRYCFASDQGERIHMGTAVVSVAGASWRMEKRAHNSRLQPSHSTRSIAITTS